MDNDRGGDYPADLTGVGEEPGVICPRSWNVPRPIRAAAGVEFGDPMLALSLREEDAGPPGWTWDEGQGPIRSSDIVAIRIEDGFTYRQTSPDTLFHLPTHGGKTIGGILEKDKVDRGENTVYTYMLGGEDTGLPVWLETEWRAPLIALTPWMKDAPLGKYIRGERRRGHEADALCKKVEFRRISSPGCPACGLRKIRSIIGIHEQTRAHVMGHLHGICPCCDNQCPGCI